MIWEVQGCRQAGIEFVLDKHRRKSNVKVVKGMNQWLTLTALRFEERFVSQRQVTVNKEPGTVSRRLYYWPQEQKPGRTEPKSNQKPKTLAARMHVRSVYVCYYYDGSRSPKSKMVAYVLTEYQKGGLELYLFGEHAWPITLGIWRMYLEKDKKKKRK